MSDQQFFAVMLAIIAVIIVNLALFGSFVACCWGIIAVVWFLFRLIE